MDRRRAGSPVFSRQKSGDSSSTGSSSPAMSPAHHRSAAVGLSNVKKTQNVAAKAAAARLAQVMASQTAAENDEEEEEEEDLLTSSGAGFRYGALRPALNSNGGGVIAPAPLGRPTRSPSPALGRNFMDHAPSARSTSAGRPSISVRSAQPVPQNRTALRTPSPIPAIEPPIDRHRDKRFPIIASHPHGNIRETGNKRETSALQDELDVLQEENENLLDKLRLAEERSGEAEARARELEKQVAALGEGVSLEARLLNRKEAALRQREAALKAAKQTREGRDDEIAALRQQLESAKDEATNAMEKFHEAEIEAKTLLTMTQRMILTQEEMEEVVLKRCWLARYWGLAVQHGVFPEIAVSKHEHWSSLAPLPFEIVTSAGQKAKEDSWSQDHADPDGKNKLVRELSDINGEGNIESMLSVEMGLRELSSLKVEDAVMLALTQHRRPNLVRQSTSDLKSHGDPKFMDSVELSQEELLDILFKQAWLIYFWRRAKVHGVEEDIADDRLEFWIAKSGQQFSSHDAVDVERGLIEMRKLGIEQQLWEASRRETEEAASLDTALKPNTDAEAPA